MNALITSTFTRLSKTVVASISAIVVLLALTGCNTFEGAGKDLEAAGESIQEAARD